MKPTRKFTRLGRRNFLQALSGLGLSGASLAYMTKDRLSELTADPRSEVPRLGRMKAVGNDPAAEGYYEPEYYTISRDEWEYTESRYEAGTLLKRRLREAGLPVDELGFVVKTIVDGGHRKKVVSVQYEAVELIDGTVQRPSIGYSELRDAVPAAVDATLSFGGDRITVEDVPVIVERSDGYAGFDVAREGELDAQNDYNYDHTYRPVPPGCRIRIHRDDGTYSCTGAFPAYDYDHGKWVYLTAGHCVDAEDGIPVTQLYSDLGESEKVRYNSRGWWGSRFDAATLDLESGIDLTEDLAADDGGYEDASIFGYVTNTKLKDNEGDSSYSIHKQGITTGRESGSVSTVSVGNDYFTTDADRDGGDSGGPHFEWNGDDIDIAGIHRGYTSFGNARATLYQNISDEFNINV